MRVNRKSLMVPKSWTSTEIGQLIKFNGLNLRVILGTLVNPKRIFADSLLMPKKKRSDLDPTVACTSLFSTKLTLFVRAEDLSPVIQASMIQSSISCWQKLTALSS